MGGDGSMGTTLKMLRQSKAIERSLIDKGIGLMTLPFGTGNDTAQIFGWGNKAYDENWLDDIGTLMEQISTAYSDQLSVWRAVIETKKSREGGKTEYDKSDGVDTGVCNSFDEDVQANAFVMCCYFNIGIEAEIGMSK